MPAHNWKEVDDGIFHHLHQAWVLNLADTLNSGLLGDQYYALAEQRAGRIAPDILTLEIDANENLPRAASGGSTAVMDPPKAAIKARTSNAAYTKRQDSLVIRHVSNRKIVALFEIVSRGNKSSRVELDMFVNKGLSCFENMIHFAFVDVHIPGRLDPLGLHSAIWEARAESPVEIQGGKNLISASYDSGEDVTAYVNPFSLGEAIPNLPLFLKPEFYVILPLEETYQKAFRALPKPVREEVEKGK